MCHRSGTSEPEAGCCEEPAEGCAPQKMSQGDTMTQGVSLGGGRQRERGAEDALSISEIRLQSAD